MSDVGNSLRRFRVRARHEDIQHGRVVEEPSFEAAAIAYAEHLPVHADEGQAISIIVHDLENGHEHSFVIHHGDASSA